MTSFKEIEKIIKMDGWVLCDIAGSHYQYIHPSKPGKVTIPRHNKPKDLAPKTISSILRQAGLK